MRRIPGKSFSHQRISLRYTQLSCGREIFGGRMSDMQTVIVAVIREHVENAAFFWAQRDTLAAEDPPDTEAVAFVDARLEANLDALRIAGPAVWPLIIAAMETFPEKGELFVLTHRALETGDGKRLNQAVAFARFEVAPPHIVGLVVQRRGRAAFGRQVGVGAALAGGCNQKRL